jgi:hypothetical protein
MAKARHQSQSSNSRPGNASWFDRLTPPRRDLVCVIGIYVILLVLFHGIIFSNREFSTGGDVAAHNAWVEAINHLSQTEKQEPLWVPYLFSGMPVFGSLIFPRDVNFFQQNIVIPISKVLFLGADVSWMLIPFLVMGIGMYLLARQLKLSPLSSLIAALTMALNPYAVGLPETGHGSKLIVLSYIPLMFLLTHMLFRRRDLLTLGLLTGTIATLFLSAHPQIAFYGMMLIGCYLGWEFFAQIKSETRSTLIFTGLFILALLVALATYAYQYLPAQEYASYSMRGGGGGEGGKAGLAYDYATMWSFHPFEIMNYLIPSFFGLKFFGDITADSYWGWMPFTNSAVYVGLVPVFLAILALSYRRNRITWFFAAMTAVFLLMSFGRFFGVLYKPMFEYFPQFNKFRVPVMILHLMPIPLGILAAYGFSYLEDFFKGGKEADVAKLKKKLQAAAIVIGAILIVGLVLNDTLYSFLSGFMFKKDAELEQLKQYGPRAADILAAQMKPRFETFWEGYIWFAVVSLAILGLMIAYLKKSIRSNMLAVGLLLILVVDLGVIGGKYINPKEKAPTSDEFPTDATIQALQEEGKTHQFRVFPVQGPIAQDNSLMYHLIQSAMGYSPAKLQIYQDMLDSCIVKRGNQNVVNMLNVKYLVAQQQTSSGRLETVAQPNPGGLARAWFVDSLVVRTGKSAVFGVMNSPDWNPSQTAVLEKEPSVVPGKVTGAMVAQEKAESRDLVFKTTAPATGLLVVSEIYYPAGWKAYVDGQETEIYKTNYVLRSVIVPAGTHTVEMLFEPKSYTLGYTLTLAGWGVIVVMIGAGVVRKKVMAKKPILTVEGENRD